MIQKAKTDFKGRGSVSESRSKECFARLE